MGDLTELRRMLSRHYPRYHQYAKPLSQKAVDGLFAKYSFPPIADYGKFLCDIGPGRYFGGCLIISTLSDGANSVESLHDHLALFRKDCLPFGISDVPDTCLGFLRGQDSCVFLISTLNGQVLDQFGDFILWLEGLATTLFSNDHYELYRPVEPTAREKLIAERGKFNVIVESFTSTLMKRSHSVVFHVSKNDDSPLKTLTVIVLRDGSYVGNDNTHFVHLDVSGMMPGTQQKISAELFDPFGITFTNMRALWTPELDPNRERLYKELKEI